MDISSLPRRAHMDVMREVLKLDGAVAYDIGCGEGKMTRQLARSGAQVVGIDPGPQQIRRAEAQPRAAGERYVQGSAEKLDIADASADVVVFFNSLHHVPAESMDSALAEAARILKHGGSLFIAEPVAAGPQFSLQQLYNDETAVRALALAAIGRASTHGLQLELDTAYVIDASHASFEAYIENSVAINPARATIFSQHAAELRERFERLGEKRDDGWHFAQPIRVHLFRKR